MGNVIGANVGQAPARQAATLAGLPPKVICTKVDKVCASGMKAIALGAAAIRGGDASVVVAGGMESMSNAPHILPGMRFGRKFGDEQVVDAMARDGLRDPFSHKAMGEVGDAYAEKSGWSRQAQDEYAARSFELANKAAKQGKFQREIAPVQVKTGKGMIAVAADDLKSTTLDKLAALKPAFTARGTVTAGNASTINDGAAAVVLMSEEKAKSMGVPILAYLRSWADAELEPDNFPRSPSLAIPKAMQRGGVSVDQVDFFEINEAFSVVALENARLLGVPLPKLNVYGGGVSLGHPLGCSGARIVVTLLSVLAQEGGKVGVAGICNGGGGGSALVVELPSSRGFGANSKI